MPFSHRITIWYDLRNPILAIGRVDEDFPSGTRLGWCFCFKAKRKLVKLALPGELLFSLRIRFGLLSVLARLGARANWYQLEGSYLETVQGPLYTTGDLLTEGRLVPVGRRQERAGLDRERVAEVFVHIEGGPL